MFLKQWISTGFLIYFMWLFPDDNRLGRNVNEFFHKQYCFCKKDSFAELLISDS